MTAERSSATSVIIVTRRPILRGLSELHPIFGKPQPFFLLDWAPRSLSLSQAFLSLFEEPVCIGFAHEKTMREIQI
jgi:hypothetical protein